MSKTRKLLSVVVALMMVVSMFAMTANAAYYYESEEDAPNYTQTWALSEPVDNGDGTYSVDVLLTTNYATGPIQFVLTNTNPEAAAIKDVTLGAAIPDGSDEGESNYNASISVNKSKGKVMFLYDTSAVKTIDAVEIDGVIATVVYTYSGSGSATIAIDDNAKSATNVGGTLIAARMSNGNLVTGDPITGQTVDAGNEVIIGSAAQAPTLGVIDGTIGVIDTTRTEMGEYEITEVTGYIFGVDPALGEDVNSIFEVVGDGELEIIETDNGQGTGTVVNVVDLEGTIVESYCLIIFGDVTGDGIINVEDSINVELSDGMMYEDGADGMCICAPELIFAGDVTADEILNVEDSINIELSDGMMYEDGADGMCIYQSDIMALLGY